MAAGLGEEEAEDPFSGLGGWCFVSGVGWLVLVFGVWCLVFGVWCLVLGIWCWVFGVRCLVSVVW